MARLEIEEPELSAANLIKGSPGAAESPSPKTYTVTQGFTIYDAMLLGVVLTWAVNPAALKWALQYMDPLAFNALRFLIATMLPVGLVLARREGFRWQEGDGPKFLLFGLLGHGFYQATFIVALNLTLAGNAALILSVSPAFVALFSALFGFERIRGYTWVGVALTLAGVGLVIFGSDKPLELGSQQLLGDLLILVVTMVWALYTVFSQTLLKRYSSEKLNALTMPIGSLVLLVLAAPALAQAAPTLPDLPPLFWIVMAVSGLLAVSAAYIIWGKGLQKLGATRTAIYTNLVPVLAAIISFFVLGEPLGWQFWTGMVLVLAGVSLTRFGGRLAARARVSGVGR
jgi:drug/metabolite transporter (DMT)-like permease